MLPIPITSTRSLTKFAAIVFLMGETVQCYKLYSVTKIKASSLLNVYISWLAELGIARIISIWLLQVIDLFVASDSEPVFYINVRLRRTH